SGCASTQTSHQTQNSLDPSIVSDETSSFESDGNFKKTAKCVGKTARKTGKTVIEFAQKAAYVVTLPVTIPMTIIALPFILGFRN
ncbi:hypothetical protein MNBD_PLANCTO02-2552, partial [hydrothermal vent metagenome]